MDSCSIGELLKTSNDITLLVHQNPDGDAVGSAFALKMAMDELGKDVKIVCVQSFPDIFVSVVGKIDVNNSLPAKTDLLILLDCNELHRTGFTKQIKTLSKKTPIAIIDHHGTGDVAGLAKASNCSESASSTTELIFDCLNELRLKITPEIATAILMGVYTDTGGFQHGNTTSRTLSLSSRLVRYGGDLNLISNTFIQTYSPAKRRLWGKVLSSVKINRMGLVTAIISNQLLKEAGAQTSDVSGLANIIALTNEAKAGLILVETNDGWRGTLRTRHMDIDLGRLAALLGGKGHKKAAGFSTTKRTFSGKIIQK